MEKIEYIRWNGELLACIIRAEASFERTSFMTSPEYNFQVGFVVHPACSEIAPHDHSSIEHRVTQIFEVLLIRKGRCEVDIYNLDREHVATRELREGDLLFITEGGHGFRMLEDTVFLEIKQGPYTGTDQKKLY
ncbi:MAG TPA: hypothetical protein VF553_22320 [Pyrinomonadaceae bacterium]|jgi:hypothetical protein